MKSIASWFFAALCLSLGSCTYTHGIDRILDILNFRRLHSRISEGQVNGVQAPCLRDVSEFLRDLRRGSQWANKLYDATGRYSSEFTFGNDFWSGSKTLCLEMDKTAPRRTIQEMGRNSSVPVHTVGSLSLPFQVRFNMARIEVIPPAELSKKPRFILMGICMPQSCTPGDLAEIIRLSAEEQRNPTNATGEIDRTVNVLRIRPIPGDYDWRKDPNTYILAGATTIVVLLLAVAEVCEICQRWCGGCTAQRSPADAEIGRNNNDGEARSTRKYHVATNGPPLALRFLLCFSVRRNGRKILSSASEEGSKNLHCIHGLRVFSLSWVIMVHTYLQVFAVAENKNLRLLTERNFIFQTVTSGTFSVDTFFMISGTLVAYLFFQSKTSRTSASKVASLNDVAMETGPALHMDIVTFTKLLGYRFLRLTPPYLWTIGMTKVGMRWLLNESVFEPRLMDDVNCVKFWWRNILYINSLFPLNEMCMAWSWYMANDTQFYAVGVVLLLLAMRYMRFATIAAGAFLVSSWITSAVISVQYQYHVSIQEPFALFDLLYDKPWVRLGPYLVGMLTGWLLCRTRLEIRISKMAVASGWILSVSCLGLLVYGVAVLGTRMEPSGVVGLGVIASAAYTSLGHTAWAIAVAWVVVACSTGYGGWISGILSWSALRPLSRLAYCAFLIHPLVMIFTAFRMEAPLHLQGGMVIILYLGYMVASYAIAFLMSICFEAPAVCLLKMIFPAPRTPKCNQQGLSKA